jgi:hypothetical protein
MAVVTNFTYTGPGGFTVANMGNTRTLTYGTTGGSTSNAVNLTFTTGASVATLTTAGWFKNLNFGTTSFNPGTTTLNIAGALTLSSTGTYTGLTFTPLTSATYTFNGASVGAIAFNYSGITITMGSAGACTTLTMTAGTIDFAGYNFTCSGAATYNSTGTLSNFGTFACTTFTNNGVALSLTSGAINASVSFVQSSGSFTIGGSATIGATPLFTHTAGTVTFNTSQSLAVTGTYTFTAGTLSINDGITLSTGIFSSTNTNTRTINFGLTTSPGYIALTHTTAATVVLSMAIVTGLTITAKGKWDQTQPAQVYSPQQIAGGFQSLTTVARTFTCGTTGGNSDNAPCLYVTGTGATQLPTFTTGSWFGDFRLDGLSGMTLGVSTLNINTLYSLAYFQTLITNSLSLNFVGSGFCRNDGDGITTTYGTLGTVTINSVSGTTSLTYGMCVATTVVFTSGTLECKYWVNGPFNGYSQFWVTGTFTQTGGTWYNNAVYINNCTTYTNNGATVSFNSGSVTATTSFVSTSGSFTFNGGVLGAVPLFTHTAGTATFNYNYSLTTTGTYTLTAGTLTLADGVTLDTGIFSSSGAGVRAIVFGSASAGNINLTHTTAATVVLNMAALGGFSWTGPGGFTVADMANTRTFSVGSTSGGSTTTAPNLAFTTGASVATLTTAGWFNNLDFGTTSFAIAATSLNIAGDLTLSSSGTYTGLTVTMVDTGTITNNGKTIAAFTINNGAGTATLSAALSCTTYTQTTGTINFATFNLTCSSTATFTAGTLNNIGTITCTTWTTQGTFAHSSGTITPSVSFVTLSGSYTQSGTSVLSAVPTFTQIAGNVTFRSTYALTTTGTYTLSAGTLTLGGDLTTGIFSSSSTNTRAIAFSTYNIILTHTTAATTVLNISDATNFTYTGTGGFTVGAMNNTRTFTAGITGGSTTNAPNLTFTTGASVATLTTAGWFNNLDFGTTSFTLGTTSLTITGNLTLSSSGTYTGLGLRVLGTSNITTNAKTIAELVIGTNGIPPPALTGTATLAGNLTLSGALTLTQGSLTCSTYAVQSATFASTGALTRSITGSGTYTITGAGATAFSNASATGITITGLIISMTAATAKTFAGGGATYPTLNQGGAGALTISGNNSFGDLTATTRPSTITFTISTTQTFTNFTLSGTAGNLVTINSSTAATQATLSKTSGTVSVGYLSIRDSNATGGANWDAGATSSNVSNNTGWIFGGYVFTAGGDFFAFF